MPEFQDANVNPPPDSGRNWILAIVFIYVLITPWGIQNQSVSNPDEPLYAASTREMFRGGSLVVPVFNQKLRLVKPILIYWVLLAGCHLGSIFGLPLLVGMHLGPLLMGLLAALGTFFIGKRFKDARFGFMAALVLITAHRFHDVSRSILVDMTLTALLVWAWYFFLAAVQRLEQNAGAFWALLGCYACLGGACMTKGPVLVGVFAVIPMFAFLLWSGHLNFVKRAGLWWGVPLSLCMGLWWFALLVQRGYGEDVYRFFTTQNFDRFVAAEGADGHPWPYLFYLSSLGDAFLPWVVVLPFALWGAWRARRESSGGLSWQARFIICGLVLPFAAFGLSVNKRSIYLVPLYPFLALFLIWIVDTRFLRTDEFAVKRRTRMVFAALALAALVNLGLEIFIRPTREAFYARVEFYREVERLAAGRPVLISGLDIHEAVWYLDRRGEAIEECSHEQLAEGFMPSARQVLILRADFLAAHKDMSAKFVVLGDQLKTRNQNFAVVVPKPAAEGSADRERPRP